MKSISLPVGTATAIGSMPHRQVDAAVAIALAACPDLPAAPSLPRRDRREGMVSQAAWGMKGVHIDEGGVLTVTGPLDEVEPFHVDPATALTQEPFAGLRAFLRAVADRTEPIKLQATGPLTLGLALIQAGAEPANAFAAAGTAVRQRVRSMVTLAIEIAPFAPLYFFVDEPSLAALSIPGFPIPTDRAVDLVSGSLAAVEPWAVTGLHCCGTADWRLALGAGPQVLSLSLDADVTDHAGALGVHLDRGGWLAWGAVPTDRPVGDDVGRLWRLLSDQWCELVQRGCDPLRLREQALVTPACGLAMHDPVRAEELLSMSSEIAERIRRQSFGVRLSVGA